MPCIAVERELAESDDGPAHTARHACLDPHARIGAGARSCLRDYGTFLPLKFFVARDGRLRDGLLAGSP